MVLRECFTISISFVEIVLPITFGFLSWAQFHFGAKSAEATIEKLFTLIAESFIPWWLSPASWIIVVILTALLCVLYFASTQTAS